jgi:hypothetical protein
MASIAIQPKWCAISACRKVFEKFLVHCAFGAAYEASAGFRMVMADVDIRTVAQWTGHRTIQGAMRYA